MRQENRSQKKRYGNGSKHERENDRETETEIDLKMLLLALQTERWAGSQAMQKAYKSRRREDTVSSRACRGTQSYDTLNLGRELWNPKIMNLCGLKPLNLRSFVLAAVGNKYIFFLKFI